MNFIKNGKFKKFVLIPMLSVGLILYGPLSMNVYATEVAPADNEDKNDTQKKDTVSDKKTQMSALEQSIKDKEEKISSAKDEKTALANGKANIENIKKSLESNKANLAAYVSQLDAQVAELQASIDDLSNQIVDKEADIEQTKKELAEAIEIRDEQYANMKKRVQAIYEQGDGFYVELILNSGGLADFLNEMDYVEDLSRYDDNMFKTYAQTVEYVSLCQQQLEAEEEVLEETKATAEANRAAVEQLIGEKQEEIRVVTEEIVDKERAIREYEAEIAEQNSIISELERVLAAEKSTLANMRVYDGGKFCWPCPSYTRISSDYGFRNHPILGIEKFHNGVDMAAPGGTNILAAYDGTVVAASYSASMGNYVMLDHGDGLVTIYMHASKLLVSNGQDVSRGDVIALVGTTGTSTGNHLHFTVRNNGEYVSPWNYITKP